MNAFCIWGGIVPLAEGCATPYRSTMRHIPRLYVDQPLHAGVAPLLSKEQTHHLRNVLRQTEGATVLAFNGKDGDWSCVLRLGKREAALDCEKHVRPQQDTRGPWLLIPPLRREAMGWLVEKATELGITALWPIRTAHSQAERLNPDRIRAQMIEAAQQCERQDIPALHPLLPLDEALANVIATHRVLACVARDDALPFPTAQSGPLAVLVGPEGGWSATETTLLTAHAQVHPVSLGPRVLRAETAALACIAALGMAMGR